MIHEGEAVVPRAFNPAAGGEKSSNANDKAELQDIRDLLERMLSVSKDTAQHAKTTSRTLQNVTQGGDSMLVSSSSDAIVIGI